MAYTRRCAHLVDLEPRWPVAGDSYVKDVPHVATFTFRHHHKSLAEMKTIFISLASFAVLANCELLDLGSLLTGLGPAPDTDPRWTSWKPAGAGDSRSPCPALNSLANHGFLNHNGKGITIPQLIQGGAQGLNVGPDFMSVVGALGLLSSPNPLSGKFDLSDLDQVCVASYWLLSCAGT